MIFDANTILMGSISATGVLSGQACNSAGNILSTNTIDNGPLTLGANQLGDEGAGEPLEVSFTVMSAPTVGTSVQFQLVQADDAALSSNLQVLVQTGAFPIASLPIGTVVPLSFNRSAPNAPKRYIGAQVVNVGAIATASYFAGVGKDVQDFRGLSTSFYKSGFSVL
jgi:hypothetical protein